MKGYASKKLLMPYMRLAKNISHYSIHQIFAEQNVHAYLDDSVSLKLDKKIGNQMQNLFCRNVRNVKFPKIVAEKFAFYRQNNYERRNNIIVHSLLSQFHNIARPLLP